MPLFYEQFHAQRLDVAAVSGSLMPPRLIRLLRPRIYPVILGSDERLLGDRLEADRDLVGLTAFRSGVLAVDHQPVAARLGPGRPAASPRPPDRWVMAGRPAPDERPHASGSH